VGGERGCGWGGTKGGVDEDHLEEVLRVVGDAEGGEGVEHAEGVALFDQFRRLAVVKRPRDDKNDVIDHVAVSEDVGLMGGGGGDVM
jgi:hypothetical protein